jgi:hypothetical protein
MADYDRRESAPLELNELEPSPVEETPGETAKDGFFPPTSSTTTSRPGLSGHSPTFYRPRRPPSPPLES